MSRRTETAYKAIIRASQHHMTKSHGFRRSGKCCGCVATVHVLIRGDLLHMRFVRKARFPVTVAVMEQKSAEAIVDKDSTTHGGVVAGNKPGKDLGSLTLSKGRT
jgi:hypothetical protein